MKTTHSVEYKTQSNKHYEIIRHIVRNQNWSKPREMQFEQKEKKENSVESMVNTIYVSLPSLRFFPFFSTF